MSAEKTSIARVLGETLRREGVSLNCANRCRFQASIKESIPRLRLPHHTRPCTIPALNLPRVFTVNETAKREMDVYDVAESTKSLFSGSFSGL